MNINFSSSGETAVGDDYQVEEEDDEANETDDQLARHHLPLQIIRCDQVCK